MSHGQLRQPTRPQPPLKAGSRSTARGRARVTPSPRSQMRGVFSRTFCSLRLFYRSALFRCDGLGPSGGGCPGRSGETLFVRLAGAPGPWRERGAPYTPAHCSVAHAAAKAKPSGGNTGKITAAELELSREKDRHTAGARMSRPAPSSGPDHRNHSPEGVVLNNS